MDPSSPNIFKISINLKRYTEIHRYRYVPIPKKNGTPSDTVLITLVYIQSSIWIFLLQTFLSATILSSNSSNFISFFTTSIQVIFGLSLNFLPYLMSIFSTLLTGASVGLRSINMIIRFLLISEL